MEIGNFLQAIGDKLGKIMVPNSISQDLITIKIAIGLISISLLFTALAMLVMVLSHLKTKRTLKLMRSNPYQIASLPRRTDKTK